MNATAEKPNVYDPNFKGRVIIESSPVSERYWKKDDEALVENGQIRLGGCWFKFDERTIIKK